MSNTDSWWNSLTASEREQLMGQQMGVMGPAPFDDELAGGTQADPYNWEGIAAALAQDPNAFNFTYTPSQMVQPGVDYFTTKGKIDYTDRAQEAARVNLLQDYGALSVDNILNAYAGGGAYDPAAFTPTYDYGTPLNLTGRRKAEAMATKGGWQGYVADLMLNEGVSPAEAESLLYKFIATPEDDPSLTPQENEQKKSVIASMEALREEAPTGPQIGGGQRQRDTAVEVTGGVPYNTLPISEFTNKIWDDLMSDPDVAYTDEKTGLSYAKTPEQAMIKTDLMKKFDAFGVPYPVEDYGDQEWIDRFAQQYSGMGPDQLAAAGEQFDVGQRKREQEVTDLERRGRTAGTAADELQRAYEELQALPTEPTGGGKPANPYNLEYDLLMEATKAARERQEQILASPEQMAQMGAPSMEQVYEQMGVGPQDRSYAGTRARKGAEAAYPDLASSWRGQLMGRLLGEESQRVGRADLARQRQGEGVAQNAAGDLEPFDYGKVIGGAFPGTLLGTGYKPNTRQPLNPTAISSQRKRASDLDNQRAAAYNRALQSQYNDPRLAQVEAMVRAHLYSQQGKTPFLDAMATRNANARRMLSGG